MKIDPNQTPQPGKSPDQETDSARVQGKPAPGTPAQGTAAPDTPLSSPFHSLLTKGRRGEGDSPKGGEAGDLMGEKGKPGGALTTSPDTTVSPDPRGAGQRGGLTPSLGRTGLSGLKGEQPGEGKTGAGFPPLHGPRLHSPLSGATARTAVPETSSKPSGFGPGRNLQKQPDTKRSHAPMVEQKTAAPSLTAPMEVPALRGLEDQPAVSQVHAAGSTADVERIQALTQEMVDKIQTSKGPGGGDQVDIQFNSRTLQGLQVSISHNDAGVSVRFNTASEQVSQLLSQNVQTLVQALAAKGVEVGDVRVVPTTTTASETFNSGSGSASTASSPWTCSPIRTT